MALVFKINTNGVVQKSKARLTFTKHRETLKMTETNWKALVKHSAETEAYCEQVHSKYGKLMKLVQQRNIEYDALVAKSKESYARLKRKYDDAVEGQGAVLTQHLADKKLKLTIEDLTSYDYVRRDEVTFSDDEPESPSIDDDNATRKDLSQIPGTPTSPVQRTFFVFGFTIQQYL